ncbi:MAG: 6-phosphogluconolactonase [Candidatus Dormibacteraeota bacterium]|nr:6-phosphogluconolactonase [Candidatus Dormibacteraeota bacterium]
MSTDPIGVAATVAGWLVDRTRESDRFAIALAGGSTPRFLYEALATSAFRGDIDWGRWHVFFGDERAVGADNPASNYRLAHDTLLVKVGVPDARVHRMEAERPDLDAAGAEYSALLERERGAPPRLDVVLLGLGTNGHTASLFPGTPALDVVDAWATRGVADYEPVDRITMTAPAINAAAHVAFLVTGGGKAEALRGVAAGTVPAALVRPRDGDLTWFLDEAAAASVR